MSGGLSSYDAVEKVFLKLGEHYTILQALYEKCDFFSKIGRNNFDRMSSDVASLLDRVICESQLIECVLWFDLNGLYSKIHRDCKELVNFGKGELFVDKLFDFAFQENPGESYFDDLFTMSNLESVQDKHAIVFYILLSQGVSKPVLNNFCQSFLFPPSKQKLIRAFFILDQQSMSDKPQPTQVRKAVDFLIHPSVTSQPAQEVLLALEHLANRCSQKECREVFEMAGEYARAKLTNLISPESSSFSHCKAFVNIMMNNGRIAEAFFYQRDLRSSTEEENSPVNHLLGQIFEFCKQERDQKRQPLLFKQLLQLSFDSFEENMFMNSFRNTDVLILYLLQRSRHLEVQQLNPSSQNMKQLKEFSRHLLPAFLTNASIDEMNNKIVKTVQSKEEKSVMQLPISFSRPFTIQEGEQEPQAESNSFQTSFMENVPESPSSQRGANNSQNEPSNFFFEPPVKKLDQSSGRQKGVFSDFFEENDPFSFNN